MRNLTKPWAWISGIAGVAILLGVLGFSGCSQKNLTNVIPYVPPSYYNSTLILPYDLSSAYWSPYITRTDATRNFSGKTYVFKDLKVTAQTLATVNKGYVWVDLVKAFPLIPANLQQLKVGESIDVVGVLDGGCKDFPNSLAFSSCVFIPSGFIDLPAGDAAQFQYTPTY